MIDQKYKSIGMTINTIKYRDSKKSVIRLCSYEIYSHGAHPYVFRKVYDNTSAINIK